MAGTSPAMTESASIPMRVLSRSVLPGVGDLVQGLAAESLGGARDRAATQIAVEIDRGFVVGERPDHQAVHAALGEIAPCRLKQLAAKAETLKFGTQIELINLAVVIQAACAIATVVGVARHRVAEDQNGDAAAAPDRAFPPRRAATIDQLVEFRTRDHALVRGAPSFVMSGRNGCRV